VVHKSSYRNPDHCTDNCAKDCPFEEKERKSKYYPNKASNKTVNKNAHHKEYGITLSHESTRRTVSDTIPKLRNRRFLARSRARPRLPIELLDRELTLAALSPYASNFWFDARVRA
jgi:hypothetical protein